MGCFTKADTVPAFQNQQKGMYMIFWFLAMFTAIFATGLFCTVYEMTDTWFLGNRFTYKQMVDISLYAGGFFMAMVSFFAAS